MRILLLILFPLFLMSQDRLTFVNYDTGDGMVTSIVINDILDVEGNVISIESNDYNVASNENGIFRFDEEFRSSGKVRLAMIKPTDKPTYTTILGEKIDKPNIAGVYTMKYGTLTKTIIYHEDNGNFSTYGAINGGL